MQKASADMELRDWEVVDDGFFDLSGTPVFNPNGIVNMDYFVCPPPASCRSLKPDAEDFFPVVEKDLGGELKDIGEVPIVGIGDGQKAVKPEMISQVYFKRKTNENEFVDMIMDPPRSPTRGFNKPQIEIDPIEFEVKEESKYKDVKKGSEAGGLTIWRWRITGIGALCSLGVAAATICILIISSRQRHSKQQQQNQKLRFQIYADDKRIKQVVHQATRLNQALTAVRGVPLTRAKITFGGYFDGI